MSVEATRETVGLSVLSTQNTQNEQKKQSSTIMVAVRLRPLWQQEVSSNQFSIVKILDSKVVILRDPSDFSEEHQQNELRKNRTREKHYAFDFAFNEQTGTKDVFDQTSKHLCDGVLNGYNSTVFAYGATGAGKTHTMLGTEQNPGVMYHTMAEIFMNLKQHEIDRIYTIKVSFLEIYNENIRDLLVEQALSAEDSSPENFLDLREDPLKGVCVSGLSEVTVSSAEEILNLLIEGNMRRTVEATGANKTSSRSHAVLQIICQYSDKSSGISSEVHIGKLSLIDLAGSERASRTNNRGQRMIEGANINRSLLALGNCINALHENVTKGQSNYVPFRDSKLTRLLKDSLGGNCRTVMIANIAPSNINFEDTHNTLKYANRAKNIKTNVQRNTHSVEYHVSQYTDIIARLRHEISDLKSQLKQQNGAPMPNSIGYKPLGLQNSVQSKSLGSGSQLKQINTKTSLTPNAQTTSALMQDQATLQAREQITQHFSGESKAQKRIHELENRIESIKMQIMTKNNEISKIAAEKGPTNIQIKLIKEEVEEQESKIKNVKSLLDTAKKAQKDLVGIRQQLKSQFHNKDNSDLLAMVMTENIRKLQNVELAHKNQFKERQIKMKEAETYNLTEQLKIRDEVISKAKSMLKNLPQNNGASSSLSSREGASAGFSNMAVTPSVKEITHVLSDSRLKTIDEIQKHNFLLPPILQSQMIASQNVGYHRRRVAGAPTSFSPQQRGNLNQQPPYRRPSQDQGFKQGNAVYRRRNNQLSNIMVKNNLNANQYQSPSSIKRPAYRPVAQRQEGQHSRGVSVPGSVYSRIKLSPRMQNNYTSAQKQVHSNSLGVAPAPLYARGNSKIGSGVTRPFDLQNKLQSQQLSSKSPSPTRSSQAAVNSGSRRLRNGPLGQNSGNNYHQALMGQHPGMPAQQVIHLEESKQKSQSVVSTGDSTNSNRSVPLRALGHRRVASGYLRNNNNYHSPQTHASVGVSSGIGQGINKRQVIQKRPQGYGYHNQFQKHSSLMEGRLQQHRPTATRNLAVSGSQGLIRPLNADSVAKEMSPTLTPTHLKDGNLKKWN